MKWMREPRFMLRLHAALTVAWLALIPVSVWRGWLASVIFVSAISLYANVASHWAAVEAARTEVAQSNEIDSLVDALIERTNIERAAPTRSDMHPPTQK